MKKVLIINDSRFESAILKDLLTKLEYMVKTVNEYSALQEVSNYLPDIVICNLIMKETSGDLLIKKIKNMHNSIICFLSSCSNLNIEDYRYNNVDEIIKTPVNLEELNKLLERFSSKATKAIFAFCPYCGGKVGEKAYSFCPYCGEKLNKLEARI